MVSYDILVTLDVLFFCDVVLIVFHRTEDYILCYLRTIDADELHAACVLSWDVLVCAEVVDEAADDVGRYLIDVGHGSVYCVALEDSDDLVVCLIVVEKTKTSDRACIHDDVSVSHILLCKDTDIKWVTVTFDIGTHKGLVCKLCHLRTAICPRKEAVKRRNYIGEFLRTVKRKIS